MALWKINLRETSARAQLKHEISCLEACSASLLRAFAVRGSCARGYQTSHGRGRGCCGAGAPTRRRGSAVTAPTAREKLGVRCRRLGAPVHTDCDFHGSIRVTDTETRPMTTLPGVPTPKAIDAAPQAAVTASHRPRAAATRRFGVPQARFRPIWAILDVFPAATAARRADDYPPTRLPSHRARRRSGGPLCSQSSTRLAALAPDFA